MTPPLVPLHVAPHAERFAAAAVRALERFLSSVRMTVNLKARWTRKGFVARGTDVSVL